MVAALTARGWAAGRAPGARTRADRHKRRGRVRRDRWPEVRTPTSGSRYRAGQESSYWRRLWHE